MGIFSLGLGAVIVPDKIAVAWLAWWAGDAIGILVIFPLILVLFFTKWKSPPFSKVLEIVLILVALAMTAIAFFNSTSLFLFLIFPFIIWAALRFQSC